VVLHNLGMCSPLPVIIVGVRAHIWLRSLAGRFSLSSF